MWTYLRLNWNAMIHHKITMKTAYLMNNPKKMRPQTILGAEFKQKVGSTCTKEKVGWMDASQSFAITFFNDLSTYIN